MGSQMIYLLWKDKHFCNSEQQLHFELAFIFVYKIYNCVLTFEARALCPMQKEKEYLEEYRV